ncbi:MAG: 8-amino-7-oxononanoate synthase [Bacteroidota bacterium]
MNSFEKELTKRKERHLLRTLRTHKKGIDFYSNDYLGLAGSNKLSQSISNAYESLGEKKNGATGSRLLSGNTFFIENLESQIATFHQSESALTYGSGYDANLGLISCLAKKGVTLFMDELLHASLIDGARLGVATRVKFKHNDIEDLGNKLAKHQGEKLVVVESIYSMDGDLAPLEDVLKICQKNHAGLIVDEAHAIGVFGEHGEGIAQQLGIHSKLFARIITYGKGPGVHGAAVVGPGWLRDYQINFSRPFIFSTAPSSHFQIAIASFYQLVGQMKDERNKLTAVVAHFIKKRSNRLGWLPSPSHIQSLIVPGNEQVVELSRFLERHDVIALPIRTPSVPEGQERLRFCLHAFNTVKEIDHLFKTLSEWEGKSS